jgi:hypothetical protein
MERRGYRRGGEPSLPSCSSTSICRIGKRQTRCALVVIGKDVLSLELTDAGFDFSVLREFRA